MTICNVLSILPVDGDTAVVVDSPRMLFKNGIGILDENGKPFEVLSVGMESPTNLVAESEKTSLLLAGKFSSKKIFV